MTGDCLVPGAWCVVGRRSRWPPPHAPARRSVTNQPESPRTPSRRSVRATCSARSAYGPPKLGASCCSRQEEVPASREPATRHRLAPQQRGEQRRQREEPAPTVSGRCRLRCRFCGWLDALAGPGPGRRQRHGTRANTSSATAAGQRQHRSSCGTTECGASGTSRSPGCKGRSIVDLVRGQPPHHPGAANRVAGAPTTHRKTSGWH